MPLDDGVAELRADLREFLGGGVPPGGRYGVDIDEVQLAQGESQGAEPLGKRRQPWIAGIVCLYPVDVRGHVLSWIWWKGLRWGGGWGVGESPGVLRSGKNSTLQS